MLYRIQSTALGQSGNTLLILPNATITVRDASGDLARLYADPDEITEIPNPTLSDAAGGYDFYVEYGDYYDITVALNGQSVDDRVYPIDMGLGARVDAAAATATEQAEIATTKAGEANTSAGEAADDAQIASEQAEIATTAALPDTMLFLVGEDAETATFVTAARAIVTDPGPGPYSTISIEVI